MYKLYLFIILSLSQSLVAQDLSHTLEPLDVFNLEFISDPQISPDGKKILYLRNFKDIMTDGNYRNLWIMNVDGSEAMPITNGNHADGGARWSPEGDRFVYSSSKDGSSQLYLFWPKSGAEYRLTNLPKGISSPVWSADGMWVAFTMQVPYEGDSFAKMPSKPKGAKWNDPPVVIDKLQYRRDGGGYVPNSYSQIFMLSIDGGTPIQLTNDPYNHSSNLSWSQDGQFIYYSANGHEDRVHNPNNSEIHRLEITSRTSTAITNRDGPDRNPAVSPNGEKIAYLGFDEKYEGYQITRLYIMNIDGSMSQCISCDFDRSVGGIRWAANGQKIFFQYDNEGNGKIAEMALDGTVTDLVHNVGGTSLGRPYSGGSYSAASDGAFAFTHSQPDHPADLAYGKGNQEPLRLTQVNADLFHFKDLGEVEEIWYESSFDQRKIQGWIVKPPDFDPAQKYPLILEIHGGPFANYGDRFTAECQLYASAGYVVLYTNPRGSSSYGKEFGNLIHHNYPSQDYDDLMSGVDAVFEKGYIDADRLYVTGGSGGGVLTSWIIGKTDRFRAAVVAKPVINWYSFVLYADGPAFFYKYWFPGKPWEHTEHYMQRSPISLVGNVTTPTMLLTGEADYRTPMAETEQYYAALQINGVESMMVRIPGAGHGIANKPSNLIAKVTYILAWFDKYK